MTEGRFHSETAGALLRAARERQGLHIAALATAIKVSPRKLDALENDRWDELPDATFTRALAQTVCRSLKIDATPVLERLPTAERPVLDGVIGNLNMPFSDATPGAGVRAMAAAIRPMVWAGLLLLVAAVVVYALPASVWPTTDGPTTVVADLKNPPGTAAAVPQVAPVAPSPVAAAAEGASGVTASASTPLATAPLAAAPAALAAPATVVSATAPAVVAAATPVAAQPAAVQLRAVQPSWIEARDASGRVLLSRVMPSGESLSLDGQWPIRLTVGNASGTQVTLRGKLVDLGPQTRDNVARLELR